MQDKSETVHSRWENTSGALTDFRESTKAESGSDPEKFIDNFLECAKDMSESAMVKMGEVATNIIKATLKETDKFDSTVLVSLPFWGIAAGAAYLYSVLPHPNESMYLIGNITSGQFVETNGLIFASIAEAISIYSLKSKRESKQNGQ